MSSPGPASEGGDARADRATRPPSPADVAFVRRLSTADHGWAVIATARGDGSIQASIVTAGVMEYPLDGQPMVALVARGGTVKLANLRRRPWATVTFRGGREWVTVEGRAWLIGPDDPAEGFVPSRVPQLLRDVFTAAGGTH